MNGNSFELQYKNIGSAEYPCVRNETNSIFLFATKELSQDAFIAWCINKFNDEDKLQRAVSINFLSKILSGCEKSKHINCNDITELEVKLQHNKIDILVTFIYKTEKYFVIIEDKVHATESEKQIEKYLNKIKDLSEKPDENHIITVYCKTGFWFPNDFSVIADVKIDSFDLYEFLKKHTKTHLLIDDYVNSLKNTFYKWETYKNLIANIKSGKELDNVLFNHIGQILLIYKIFKNNRTNPKMITTTKNVDKYELFIPSLGSSYGSQYTQFKIFEHKTNDETIFKLFWRIGKYGKGWCISLKSFTFNLNKSPLKFNSKQAHTIVKNLITTPENIHEIINSSESVNERQLITLYFNDYNNFIELKDVILNVTNVIIDNASNLTQEFEQL